MQVFDFATCLDLFMTATLACTSKSLSLSNSPVMSLCICSHLLLEETSLMMTEQDTVLWGQQNAPRSHFNTMLLYSNSSILFFSRSLVYLASASYPSEQSCLLVPSNGICFKSSQILGSVCHMLWSTLTLTHLAKKPSSFIPGRWFIGFQAELVFTFLFW